MIVTTSPSAIKAKGVATHDQDAGKDNVRSQVPGSELAGQLNEKIRNKYVKGKLDSTFFSLFLFFFFFLFSLFKANLNIQDKKLGEGTYAVVYLGHLLSDRSSQVAIKRIKVNAEYRDGLALDAIREVKHLQELFHPNVIALHDVFSSKDQNLNLVLEYLPGGDLEMLIKDGNVQFGVADVKAWMGMLARGVWFCHENFVLHRDIKPNNLLIGWDGEVKLADFGLARSFADPYVNMTHQVITRWYRPPELLYGARHYSGAVDIWSMGMVFAELLLRVPFIAGNSDLDQLYKICEAFGTPTEENWPGVSKLPNYMPADRSQIVPLQGRDFFWRHFPIAGPAGVELLMSMCTLDPRKRRNAREILEHGWWNTEPKPTYKEDLPKKTGGTGTKKMGIDLTRRGGEFENIV